MSVSKVATDPERATRHAPHWIDSRDFQIRAARSFDLTIERGAKLYDRQRILPRLLPISRDDIRNILSTRKIVLALSRALRTERNRGRAGHWSYDMSRHIALMQALRAEQRVLKQASSTQGQSTQEQLKTEVIGQTSRDAS